MGVSVQGGLGGSPEGANLSLPRCAAEAPAAVLEGRPFPGRGRCQGETLRHCSEGWGALGCWWVPCQAGAVRAPGLGVPAAQWARGGAAALPPRQAVAPAGPWAAAGLAWITQKPPCAPGGGRLASLEKGEQGASVALGQGGAARGRVPGALLTRPSSSLAWPRGRADAASRGGSSPQVSWLLWSEFTNQQ